MLIVPGTVFSVHIAKATGVVVSIWEHAMEF
jgi:hypothetical protein